MGFWSNIWDTLGDSYRRTKWYKPDNPPSDTPEIPPELPPEIPPEVPADPQDFITALTEGDWNYILDLFGSLQELLTISLLVIGGLFVLILLRR